MAIIVQKYGGTSLRDGPGLNFLLGHVSRCQEEGHDLVVVVSSMGRKGEPYATDTLISELEKININIDPMKKDLLMSCGEIISSALVAHFLESNGIPAVPLTGFQGGILTDNNFNSAEIIDIDTRLILKHLKDGKVVVVAGFQGITSNMEITTLGRGGSDITAVSLGGFLGAKRVDIFTDVEGVALVDPRIVPFTKYLEGISYSNMYDLALNGASVIHPKAVLAAEKYNIPVHICGSFSSKKGTIISKARDSSQDHIIGITLENKTSTGKNMDHISLFFIEDNPKIQKDIKAFLSHHGSKLFQVLWQDNRVEFIIDSCKTIPFTKILYRYFFE